MATDPIFEEAREIALRCLSDEELPVQVPITQLEEVKLLGSTAVCDSLGLVRYLLALEEGINAAFDTWITLMDERAMSQLRSPFRNLSTLIDYVVTLVSSETRVNDVR